MSKFREERLRAKMIFGGGLIGVMVAGALALPSILPAAIAEEEPLNTLLSTGNALMADEPITEDTFFKPDWTIEPSVNTDIVKQQIVRKIGFGQTEFVTIVTTPTGTYSSDGAESPYIRYPGLHDTRSREAGINLLGIWNGATWTILKPLTASSFATVLPVPGGNVFVDENGTCTFAEDGTVYC